MKYALGALAITVLVAGLAMAGDAPALQGPALVAKESDRLCRSAEARDVAWGAYLAATHAPAPHAPSPAPWVAPLEKALLRHAASGSKQDVLVVRAILDAFIQRGARPSAETLARCIRHHPYEVIVLCAQDPERYERVLQAMLSPGMRGPAWMAIANLLRARKAPGAMFQVLRGASTKLEVSVLVEKNSVIGVGGGSPDAPRHPMAVDHGVLKIPEGWPPAVHYRILDYVWRGCVVLAPGSHPVFYQRHESSKDRGERRSYHPSISRNAFRYHVLADCMGRPFHEMRVSQRTHKVVTWEGEEGFIRNVAEQRHYLRLFWDGEIDAIARDGYVTKEEAAQLELDVPIESTWMAQGAKRKLPEVPEGIPKQELERRARKRDLKR